MDVCIVYQLTVLCKTYIWSYWDLRDIMISVRLFWSDNDLEISLNTNQRPFSWNERHFSPSDCFRCYNLNSWWTSDALYMAPRNLVNIGLGNDLSPFRPPEPLWTFCLLVPWERLNSLCPSDAIWRHRSRSTLAQVMACCLTAPSHYLKQCWLIISTDQWCLRVTSPEIPKPSITKISFNWLKFLSNLPGANEFREIPIEENAFENVFKMTSILSQPQCVNSLWPSDVILHHGP